MKKQAMEKEPPFIPRTLIHLDKSHNRINDNELDPSIAPIVILGEAGMGKSRLLTQLATQHGWDIIRADTVILTDDSPSTVLLIDALDETTDVGSALIDVLRQLKIRNRPPCIICCRTSDWSHENHASYIKAAYGKEPRVLHLKPLDDEGIHTFLLTYLVPEQIIKLQSHLERSGLAHWLGNPHTLKLIAKSAAHGKLPHNRSELFQYAVEKLVSEHNGQKANHAFALKEAFELAGAICAALLLTGHTVISLELEPKQATDFSIVELKQIPNGIRIKDLLGTRLFRAIDTNRFECIHRSIAEYLAACWLASKALPNKNQRRLLGMFHQHDIVPSGLRGIHAWLCMNSKLSQRVIRMDPTGVIENADLANLDVASSNLLIEQLEVYYTSNPTAFSWWRPCGTIQLADKNLMKKLSNIGKDRNKPVQLRLLVLESLAAAAELEPFKKLFMDLLHNCTEDYAVRRVALQALFNPLPIGEVHECINVLYRYADMDSVRLAFDLSCLVNFDGVEDKLLTTLIISCSHQNERFGELDKFVLLKSNFPVSRLTSLLNCLVDQIPIGPLSPEFFTQQAQEFHELLNYLTLVVIKDNSFSSAQAWRMFTFLCSTPFYTTLDLSIIEHLSADIAYRHAVQQYVMFDLICDESLDQRYEQLQEVGLNWSENDLIALLTKLDANDLQDERWRALVGLWHHDNLNGVQLRAAALQFAGNHPQRRDWAYNIELDLSRQARRERLQHENQRREEQNRHNANAMLDEHKAAIANISQGDHRYLMLPAQTYMRGCHHINNAGERNSKVVQWAGNELATAVFQGFENYLLNIQTRLSPEEVSQHFARLSLHKCSDDDIAQIQLSPEIILSAALEHMHTQKSFASLTFDALLAIFLSLKHPPFRALSELEKLIHKILSERSLLTKAMKFWFEPYMLSGEFIPFFHTDNREIDNQYEKIITKLISEWLECLPDLPECSQYWCLQHLANNAPEALLPALQHCIIKNSHPMPLFIEAVQLIMNFEEMSALLINTNLNPELLLALRDFQILKPSVATSLWIIEKFRSSFPKIHWVKGNLSDENWPSQQSEYLQLLILQLSEQKTPEAQSAMNLLCEAPHDSYTDYLFERRFFQRQSDKGKVYQPLKLEEFLAIMYDEPPRTGADLLAFLLEQLDVVQQRIKNDELSSWKLFYKDDAETPQGEEYCRDRLIGMFENIAGNIRFVPESRVADQKRVDIMCEIMNINLPIEIKGSWNRQLWSAVDQQLNNGYVSFHRGSELGIYLVLWFGNRPRKPPRPADKSPIPSSPEQLKTMLEERSEAVKAGRVKVVVMDMTRSN